MTNPTTPDPRREPSATPSPEPSARAPQTAAQEPPTVTAQEPVTVVQEPVTVAQEPVTVAQGPAVAAPPAGGWQPLPGRPVARRSVVSWFGTRTGVGVLVAVLMFVFGVVPAGVVGFVAGWHTNGVERHQRFDRSDDRRPGWRQDGQGRGEESAPERRPFGPGQRRGLPGRQNVPAQPSPTATPNATPGT